MSIQKIGIAGAGQMGQGIAQVAAQSGFQVLVADQNLEVTTKSVQKIKAQLDKLVEKQKLTVEQASSTMANLKPVAMLADLKDCDLVIEAVSESFSLKKKIFQDLDTSVKKEALFASNTSSISITELAATTKRPAQFA